MSRGILELAGGEAGFGRGLGQVVEGMGVDLGDASAQERADEEFEALEFGLDDDEAEVGFGIRVARLLFHELNLRWNSRSINVIAARKRGTNLFTDSLQNTFHQGIGPWQYFWSTTLCDPCPGEFLQISSLAGNRMAVYLCQNVVNVHGICCSPIIDSALMIDTSISRSGKFVEATVLK